jgi:hypothetical protein
MYRYYGNDGPKMRVYRRAVITLCGIGVHRNGRTDDTFVTVSALYIADLLPIYYLSVTHDILLMHSIPISCRSPGLSASGPSHVSLPHCNSGFVTRLYVPGETRIGFKPLKLHSVPPGVETSYHSSSWCDDPHAHSSRVVNRSEFSPPSFVSLRGMGELKEGGS